ncbi:ABC transporter substrate-binding protein [Promicromonospora sp. NPDC090134]|uniref:ABC transporter substrate-binding protein n=1 Tax=Promicromonospora sp. NPDC090134 TaxID=3364408 RepID=UPI00381E8602
MPLRTPARAASRRPTNHRTATSATSSATAPTRGARAAAAVALVLLTSGCAVGAQADDDGAGNLSPDAALPAEVPAGTTLAIGDPTTQKAFELAGDEIDSDFDFEIEWANVSGGPQTIEAFNAGVLDIGAVAEIPPIHAAWTGLDVQIYASQYREDWAEHPVYELAGAPGVELDDLSDLRGKRIAFSPGQAQGALVLKSLRSAGLGQDDVELVELPSTGDVYPTALAAGEVDVAPVGGTALLRYLDKYAADGATSLRHGLRDDPSHLYGPTDVVRDPAKAAALRQYVTAWAQARVWIYENPEIWKEGYYVEDQGLTEADAQYLIDTAARPEIPSDLTDGIERTQDTIDLLAGELDRPALRATDLFDERFGPVAGEAAEQAWSTS